MLAKKKSRGMALLDIMITLAALELMAFFYYGIRAVWLGMICIAVSMVSEFILLRSRRAEFTAKDLYCVSDGLIIALMLPASIDWKIPAAACVFAAVAKHIFGGRENMIFSPSAVAYVFIISSWSKELLSYPEPYTKLGIFERAAELTDSASLNFIETGKLAESNYELLMGSFAGPMGAVSILIISVSAAVLIARKGISASAFCGTVGGLVILSAAFPYMGNPLESVRGMLVTNMTLFAAVYIISDKRIAPKKWYYAAIYGIIVSAVTYGLFMVTGKENIIISVSILLTPAALAFRNLSDKKSLSAENAKGADDNEQI